MYDKVLKGFKDTSGKCKDFIHKMGAVVTTFFAKAEDMEKGLAKSDAMAFKEVITASKSPVFSLIQEVAEAEDIYDASEASYDSVLASVAKEVKKYVQLKGEEQRKEYKKKCLECIKQDHGRLDGMCFIPMIIGNLSSHHALAMSQWVAHSHVPLEIMVAPLRAQAGAVKVYMKFVEFLTRRVIALQEKLGPGVTSIPLESEDQFTAAKHVRSRSLSHSRSASPSIKSQPPSQQGSPPPSRYGSPARADEGKQAQTPAHKSVFSSHSQSFMGLFAKTGLTGMDDDLDDDETNREI